MLHFPCLRGLNWPLSIKKKTRVVFLKSKYIEMLVSYIILTCVYAGICDKILKNMNFGQKS